MADTSPRYRLWALALLAILAGSFIFEQRNGLALLVRQGAIGLTDWGSRWVTAGTWMFLFAFGAAVVWVGRAGSDLFSAFGRLEGFALGRGAGARVAAAAMALVIAEWFVVGGSLTASVPFLLRHLSAGGSWEMVARGGAVLVYPMLMLATVVAWTARERRRVGRASTSAMPAWCLRLALLNLFLAALVGGLGAWGRGADYAFIPSGYWFPPFVLPVCLAWWSGHRRWRAVALAMCVCGVVSSFLAMGATGYHAWQHGWIPVEPVRPPGVEVAGGIELPRFDPVVQGLASLGSLLLFATVIWSLRRADARRGFGIEALELAGEEVPAPSIPAAQSFDRDRAVNLVNRAVAELAQEHATEDKDETWQVLKPWLLGEVVAGNQRDAAQRLGWTENAVRVAVHRLRRRFRELVRAEIAQTVEGDEEVREELRYLLDVLSVEAGDPRAN